MMRNISVIFRDDIPLCYGNLLIHKQSTQTQLLLLQKIVLTKICFISEIVWPSARKPLQRMAEVILKEASSLFNGVMSIKSKINSIMA
jgi:hypothetical protein